MSRIEPAAHDVERASHDKPEIDRVEHGYHDEEEEEIIHHTASIRSQLEVWHANRGNKSILRAIIPPWCPNKEAKTSKNLFALLREITWRHWLIFFSGWFCWTCDGYDYFCVSVTMVGFAFLGRVADNQTELSDAFSTPERKITTTQISFAITLTLLFRSLGALIFGVLADRFGRKWTLVANMLIIAAFELGSGFVNTYSEFLGVRSMFGIAMGGIWGQAAATCLENVPVDSRGFLSGILQQGYAVGYLLAAVINMTVGQYSAPKWRSLYFIGAGFSLAAAMLRAALPESEQYLRAREEAKKSGMSSKEAAKHFGREVVNMLKTNWIRCIWAICLMTGMNFFSHGSQDLFPTYLKKSKGLSEHAASVATIGGWERGRANLSLQLWCYRWWLDWRVHEPVHRPSLGVSTSTLLRPDLSLIILILFTAAWVPLWILPSTFPGLTAGAFWVQVSIHTIPSNTSLAFKAVGVSSRSTSPRLPRPPSAPVSPVSPTSWATWPRLVHPRLSLMPARRSRPSSTAWSSPTMPPSWVSSSVLSWRGLCSGRFSAPTLMEQTLRRPRWRPSVVLVKPPPRISCALTSGARAGPRWSRSRRVLIRYS